MEIKKRYVDVSSYEDCKIVLNDEDNGILVRDLPTADVDNVRYAHYYAHDDGAMRCSNCGASKIGYRNFCSYCGAKMLTEEQWLEKLFKGGCVEWK